MSLFMYFALFYLTPAFIVLIGTGSFVKKDPGMTVPLLILAALPVFNVLFALLVIAMLLMSFTKNPTDY